MARFSGSYGRCLKKLFRVSTQRETRSRKFAHEKFHGFQIRAVFRFASKRITNGPNGWYGWKSASNLPDLQINRTAHLHYGGTNRTFQQQSRRTLACIYYSAVKYLRDNFVDERQNEKFHVVS